jgi:hypothetical protein
VTSGTPVGALIGSGGSATKIGGGLDLIPIPIPTGDQGGDPAGRAVLDLTRAGLGDLALDRVALDRADLAITSTLVTAPERHGRTSI